jgi:hypothetical protein
MIMNTVRALLQRVGLHWIPPHEVRREALAIGGRSMGDVLAGARKEMANPGIPFRRAVLLRAVIREDARAKKARSAGLPYPARAKPKGR